jgi:ABC-2 type transport system ATP-binding protein
MDHAIVVKDVYKSFKDVKAVQGITLDISKGEYVALLGPNGAGKTTLVEMIEGIQKQDSGDIIINGLHWKGNEDQLHRVIGLSLQETNFIDKLKVKETLNLFSSFFSLPDTRADEVLEMVNLAGKSKAFVQNLSGGQRQRLALSIALLNRPEILLLDEPTTGLDPTARREVWDILVDLKKNYNTTMILTTHYMEEASYLCDRIVIMDSGKVLARGTLENLLSDHMAGEIIEFSVNGAITQSDLPDSEQLKSYKQEQASGRWVLVVEDLVEYLPKLQKVIESSGHQMTYLECRKMTLDDLFISMTGRHLDQ